MKLKHRRKLLITALAYLFFLTSSVLPQMAFAAASGHYTDLLPNPTSAPNQNRAGIIFNGYDWSVTTLAPTLTYGDELSRTATTVYQSTAPATINATVAGSTFTALGQGNVGSTTFPAAWVASGRTIETIVDGVYSTIAPPNWTWQLKLGTTTILNTGALAAPGSQTSSFFKARSVVTIGATGASGTAFGSYEILVGSATSNAGAAALIYSTATFSTVSVDLTSQLTVNPVLTFGTATSTVGVRNVSVRFLN